MIEEKELEDYTIGELEKITFEIPEYQRGYRWETNQVLNLLNDIHEYFNRRYEGKNRCYYLQPIIVKKDREKEKNYILIDGQQRLTTIYMILTYINIKKLKNSNQEIYNIEYKTIENEEAPGGKLILKDKIKQYIDDVDNNEYKTFNTLNEYYYNFAIKNINEWFNSNLPDNNEQIKNFRDFIKDNVKILWYELDMEDNDNENETFIRINTNKIKLTQADLVKAEFLRKDKNREMKELSQEQLAIEWDEIEKSLFNPQFWFFISNVNTEDRMSELLNITMKVHYKNTKNSYDENEIYNVFEQEINKKDFNNGNYHIKTTWDKIKEIFYIFNEWYEDIELYNLIGYIIVIKGENKIKNKQEIAEWIVRAINSYINSKTKEDFKKDFLIKEIKEKIFTENIRKNLNNPDEKTIRENLENINYYDNKNEIKNILILHNILTLNTLKENKVRFAFDKYKNSYDESGKKVEWDIEHIHSQHDKELNDINDKNEYLNYLKIYYINETLKEENSIHNVYDKLEKIKKLKDESYKNVRVIAEEMGLNIKNNFELDQIGNLALLDSRTNRSYGDSLFMKKRAEIIKKDEEKFIPICTKKAFLKAFTENDEKEIIENKNNDSEKILQFYEWNLEDSEKYVQDIANKLYEGIYK